MKNKLLIIAVIAGILIGFNWGFGIGFGIGYQRAINWSVDKAIWLFNLKGVDIEISKELISWGLVGFKNNIDRCFVTPDFTPEFYNVYSRYEINNLSARA